MADNDASAKDIYSGWQPQQIRLTCFSDNIEEHAMREWWKLLTGGPSDQQTVLQQLKQYQESGNYLDCKLVLSKQLDRVDWFYLPKDNESKLGSFGDSMDAFSVVMRKWFNVSPPTKRLALGFISIVPVESLKAGYEFIAKLLPGVTIDIDNSSDFLYQINRPRKTTTGIADLNINRLTKWSIQLVKSIVLSGAGIQYDKSSDYSVRLEVDINTTPEYQGVIQGDKFDLIYTELVSLLKEILIKGDTP